MKRLAIGLLVLLGSVDASAKVSSLADAPSVRHNVLLHKGRHEINPQFGLTFADPYTQSVVLGIGYLYHITDWVGIGAEFSYGVGIKTKLAQGIEREVTRDPEWKGLHPGQTYEMGRTGLNVLGIVEASFTPLSGKLVLFRKFMGYADFHVNVGVGFASVKGYGVLDSKITYALMVGGGFRLFPHKAVSVNVDVKDYMVPRVVNQPVTSKSGSTKFTQNPTFLLGVSVFLPLANETGP